MTARRSAPPRPRRPVTGETGGEAPPPARRRWRPSILLVLMLGFGGLTVAAAGTVTLIGYEIAKRNTYELIGVAARNAMGQRQAAFKATLDPAEAAVRAIAGALERRELDPEDARLTHVLEGTVIAAAADRLRRLCRQRAPRWSARDGCCRASAPGGAASGPGRTCGKPCTRARRRTA